MSSSKSLSKKSWSLGRSVARSLGRSIARSLGRSLDRSIVRSLDRSVDRAIARSLDRSTARSLGRSLDRSIMIIVHALPWLWDMYHVLQSSCSAQYKSENQGGQAPRVSTCLGVWNILKRSWRYFERSMWHIGKLLRTYRKLVATFGESSHFTIDILQQLNVRQIIEI